jgi:cellulose synthase operon protein C
MEKQSISYEAVRSLLPDLESDMRAAVERRKRPLPDRGGPRRDALTTAALVDEFDPYRLAEAVGSSEPRADAEAVIKLSAPLPRADGNDRWALRAPERQRVLRQLVADGAVAEAVDRVPEPFRGAINTVLADHLLGTGVPVADLPADRLTEAVQTFDLLRDIPGTPDAAAGAAVEARLEREYFLGTLTALAAGRFAGRTTELGDLAAYAGLAEGGDPGPSTDPRPLLIHGPGGMGKSTLLAEFLLRTVLADGKPRCPFAYLDFDRRSLSIEYPATILYESLGQLGAFYPENRAALQDLRARWRPMMRDGRAYQMQSGLEAVTFAPGRQTGSFVYDFCEAVSRLTPAARQFVLVLDTFEEVQSRSADYVAELSGFLTDLYFQMWTAGCRLRVVLSGRIAVPELPARPYPLGALTEEAARAFLVDLGVHPALAPRVAKQVRGVPLTLRLAADLILKAQDPVRTGNTPDDLHPVWYELRDAELQGQLFERYIQQIGDADVRRLAHPGLVLRRITPAIIRDVLAGPCGLAVGGGDEPPRGRTPEALFAALAKEVSLVSRESEGVLRHRPEVRAVMLDLLTRDPRMTRKVPRIHRNAVAFYEPADDPESRAEEIYHRLQLGQSGKAVGKRWLAGVEPHLKDALDELPPKSRAFLADRLETYGGFEASPDTRQAIDRDTWERYAARRAERLIKLNRPEAAREVLEERAERAPGSKLFHLDVAVCKALGDWAGMRAAAAAGVASAADAGNPKMAYALGRSLIQSILLAGDLAAAPDAVARARGLAIKGDPQRQLAYQLELDLTEIRVAQGFGPAADGPAPDGLAAVYDRAADRLRQLMADRRAHTYAELGRTAAGVLCRHDVVRDVIRQYGVTDGPLNPPRRRLLCRAMITWDEITSAARRRPDGVLADATGRTAHQEVEEWWTRLLDEQGAGVNEVIRSLADRFGLPDNALRRFGELFRFPPEAEMFAPLHTRLLDQMTHDELVRFVADELGQDLAAVTKGTDRRDVVRQLLSWAYDQGRFQELVDRVSARPDATRGRPQ